MKKNRIKKQIQKIIQTSYIFIFYFLSFGIAGNLETDQTTSKKAIFIYIICAILTFGKVFYKKDVKK